MAPTRPVLKERYEARRGELVEAAAALFAERGYDATTMSELATRTGLAAGGIYHYFASKEELLIAICDELVDPLLAAARELVEEGREPEEELRSLVALWVGQVATHRAHMLVFQQERHLVERGEQWRRVRRVRKEFERLVEEVVGRTAPQLDRRIAVSALLGMVNHTAQWYRPRGRLDPAAIAEGYVDLVLGRR